MIFLKTEDEIDLLRQSNRLVGQTLGQLAAAIRPGVTTRELDRIAEAFIRDHGAEPVFKGFPSSLGAGPFPATICASVNQQVVHGIPDDAELRDGDIVSIDCGVRLNGYCGDSAYTFPVGTVSDDVLRLLRTTKEALMLGIAAATPEHRVGDIGHAVQTHTEQAGYGVVREFVGHGVGRQMHEEPQVPNYGHPGFGHRLKRGMCIAIEPMITMGDRHVVLSPDGWTVSTRDGSMAAHYEHTIAISQSGQPEVLSTFRFIEDVLGDQAI